MSLALQFQNPNPAAEDQRAQVRDRKYYTIEQSTKIFDNNRGKDRDSKHLNLSVILNMEGISVDMFYFCTSHETPHVRSHELSVVSNMTLHLFFQP